MSSVDDSIRRMMERGLATPGQLIGCTPTEVAEVRAVAGGRLPCTYEYFLTLAGRSAELFADDETWYPLVLRHKSLAEELLARTEWKLKPTAFPFGSHGGYQFLFFDASRGDDPPVMHYMEGDAGPREVAPSFSAWLAAWVAWEPNT